VTIIIADADISAVRFCSHTACRPSAQYCRPFYPQVHFSLT